MLLWLISCTIQEKVHERDWLKEVLYADNWRYLQRSHQALAQKFRAMAESEYAFMRGSLSVQLAHWSRVSQDRASTHFLNTSDSTMVPIFGDAHPENFTISAYPGQPITTEIIDLDAAGFAPWLLDVRRALTAQRIFAGAMTGCETMCQDAVVVGWLEGFEQGLLDSDSTIVQSKIVEGLIDEALEEGSESKKYHKYTTDGRLNFDDELNGEGKGIFPISSGDRIPRQIFSHFAEEQGGTARLLDMGQRFGMGISSRAALRYVFVWDTGLDGEEDNQLLLAREVFDLPDYAGRLGIESEPFESNAHRVTRMQKMLWRNPDADPNYKGFATPFDFKTQSWSSYYQDVEVSKIQEDWDDGSLSVDDLKDLATVMGAHHASVWKGTQTLSGESAGAVILEDIALGGGFDVLNTEMMSISEVDFVVQKADYDWFLAELERSGPLLGFDLVGEW